MGNIEETCISLRARISATEEQLAGLKRDLVNAERTAAGNSESADATPRIQQPNDNTRQWPLLPEEYRRYGRQMIIPQVGLEGECNCSPKVAVLRSRLTLPSLARSTQAARSESLACWSWRARVPGRSVPRRRWGWYPWAD